MHLYHDSSKGLSRGAITTTIPFRPQACLHLHIKKRTKFVILNSEFSLSEYQRYIVELETERGKPTAVRKLGFFGVQVIAWTSCVRLEASGRFCIVLVEYWYS